MTWAQLSREIALEAERQQDLMGWPERVPAYAEIPDANGKIFFHHWRDLTVADCEQLVEFHTRKARRAIDLWMERKTARSLRNAGWNIIRARLYRCQYFSLIGKTDSTEHDMPFPFLPANEVPQ